MQKLITIREAADMLGVTMMTLRRWDESGKLPSIRAGEGTHRLYRLEDIERVATDLFSLAKHWATGPVGIELAEDVYCQTSAMFQTRLQGMEREMMRIPELSNIFSLVSSTAGEIGNNSFDHNLGLWRDIPGIFFGYDLRKKIVVLADRGQGIWQSLRRVRPTLQNDEEALKVAFTEVVTGRAPEQRGNGLKYVRRIMTKNPMELFFQTGSARLKLKNGDSEIVVEKNDTIIDGCLARIHF